MNITVLIGNGFDLNCGLKTSFKHFLKEYVLDKSGDEKIDNWKEKIKNNINTWSDLEIALGKETSNFSNDENGVKEFSNFYNNMFDSLTKYLMSEENRIYLKDNPAISIVAKTLFYNKYLLPVEKNKLLMSPNFTYSNKINYIVFNYTSTLNDGFSKVSNGNEFNISIPTINTPVKVKINHIHGTLKQNMILGVSNLNQISNTYFKTNAYIKETLIKENVNRVSHTEEELNFNECIKNSDLIIVYGMSLGESDSNRWSYIISEMKNRPELKILIMVKDEAFIKSRSYSFRFLIDTYIKRFLSYFNLSDNEYKDLYKRVVISPNCEIYNDIGIITKDFAEIIDI